VVDGILQVSLSLRPEVADIGVGEPLIAEGTVWLFGFPFGAPVLIAVHEAKNSQVLSGPVGWGFSAPFFGAFRIPIPTEGWSQGEYAFTAVVIPLADSPVTSPSASKRIVAPRYSASLQTNWKSGEKNPLTIRQDQGDRVYCRWTVENTGNVSDTYDCVLVLGLPAVQTYTYRADNIVSLAPGESSSHIVPVDVPVGAPLGLYDGYCRIYGEPDGGVFVQDEQGDVVEVVEAPPPPPPPEPPVASFTASPTSGDAPLTVQFTDRSTGDITSWSWSFGDGGTSSSRNPVHTYQAAATYTARLTVVGPGGSGTYTETIRVTEVPPPPPPAPVAGFSASPTSGEAPLTVQFTDTSTGEIDSWGWSFGDGGTSTARSPSHTYSSKGNYTARLTVTGPGGSDSASQAIEVWEYKFNIGDIVTDGEFIYRITDRRRQFGVNYYWCEPTNGGTAHWIPESQLRIA